MAGPKHASTLLRAHAIASVALALVSTASGQVGTGFGIGAGGSDGAWLSVPVPRMGVVIQHLDGREPGAASRAISLPSAPEFMAWGDGRLVLIYRLSSGAPGEGPAEAYQIRELRYERLIPNRPYSYQPQTPLAPLPRGRSVQDLTVVNRVVVVLLRDGLLRLDGSAWVDLPAPAGVDLESGDAQLLSLSGALILAQPGNSSAQAWRLSGSDDQTWERIDLAPAPRGAQALAIDSQLLVAYEQDGRLELALWRPTDLATIASIEPRATQQWVEAAGSNVGIVWSDGASTPRLSAQILTTSGQILHDGALRSAPPVGARELEVLAVLLASTVLSVTVFIFRPALTPKTPIHMPEGWVLAEPWRRGVAGVIDVGVGLLGASAIWSMSLSEMTNPASAGFAEVGIWPLLTAAGLVIALSAVGEASTGRSIGKALVGIRVISFGGKAPGFGVSLFRSTVKVLCPPLAFAALLGVPPEASPTSFGTLVISRRPPEEPSQQSPGGNDQS